MNGCRWFPLILALGVSAATAQVTVEVIQDQDQFLQGESLPVKVRITNRSGQTLHLGNSEDWLVFSIESREGTPVMKTGEAHVLGSFTLDSSKVATKRVDLTSYFVLSQPGRYSITATVRIAEWDRQVASRPKNFDIIEGSKLWEQEFGVPKASSATNTLPEVRKYILHQANYLKSHLQLYFRLTDATGAKTYRVYPVGPMVSFSRPEPQIDRFSNLHLLFQKGARSFSYTIFDSDGNLLVRQNYDYGNNRPRLQADQLGNITVTGGTRRVTSEDLPPPPEPPLTDSPPTTNLPPASPPHKDKKTSKS